MKKAIIILGILVTISLGLNIVVLANTTINSNSVSYQNNKTAETTVEGSLNELFSAVDINNRLGNTDQISDIGDGTVSGAINSMNSKMLFEDVSNKLGISSDYFDIVSKNAVKYGNIIRIVLGIKVKSELIVGKHYDFEYSIDGENAIAGVVTTVTESSEASGNDSIPTSGFIGRNRIGLTPIVSNFKENYGMTMIGLIWLE